MEYRTLEINVISAKDLKKVSLISKTHAYAVVSISGDPRASQQQSTAVDRRGNANPTWNFPMKFIVNESAARSNRLAVTFRVRSERSYGDKDIGEVHVPLSELIGSVEDGKLQFVTYQIRKPSGKPKGELNFSYKWGEKIVGATAPIAMEVNKVEDEPVTAYPAQVGSSSAYPLSPTGYAYVGATAPPAMEVNKAEDEPVTAYPAQVGSSSAYPLSPMGYAFQSQGRYPYASAAGYGYPPPPQGYGYPPSQSAYGYPPVQRPQQQSSTGRFGLGTGLLGGALGGLLLGDVLSGGFHHGGGWGGDGCGSGGCGGGGCGGDGGCGGGDGGCGGG